MDAGTLRVRYVSTRIRHSRWSVMV